ncbi:MAG: hypothetical protein IT269_06735 [Saprospiraceae bacterium]|nr:hypothetical protein [Saprospiraceae bacterium]
MDTIVVVQYNILRYGQTECGNLTTRNSRFLPIFDYLKPDVLGVNEISPNPAVFNNFELNLKSFSPGMTQTPWGNSTGSDLVNGVFYNSAKLGYLGHQTITGAIRDIDVHRLYHKSATKPGDTLDFYYIIAHFKASNGGDNIVQRAEAASLINDWLQLHPSVTRYWLGGDLNLYTNDEPAWQTLVEQTQQFYDPSGLTTDWVGSAYAIYQTQSPATSAVPCAVTGGMDDRFDFL